MISASVPMAEASFISAEQPLAPDLAADRTVLRTGGASRHPDIVFVVNPRVNLRQELMEGRVRSGESCWSRLGSECNICESLTAGPCHAIDITREAIREGADAIIAVGGYRTLHEISFIYFWMRSHIDVGFIRGESGEPHYFINIANAHLSAKAGHNASRYKTFGNLCYGIRALQAFFDHHNQDLRIKVDDGDWEVYSQVTTLYIGNAKCGGMKISPNADSSSKTFEMVILQNFTWYDVVLKLHKLFNGTHLSVNNVSSRRACSIEVQQIVTSGNIFVESDGEGNI